MIRPPTPGAYLKMRRTAALLSVADVAAALPTDPATPEHLRIEQLELIEADVQPMTLATIAALRAIYRFDIEVLLRLAALAQEQDLPEPRLCRICGDGRVHDSLFWPIQHLCRRCYSLELPAEYAAWLASPHRQAAA